MRREADFFGNQELVLVHVATRLKKALAAEKVLDAAAVDYAVVPNEYTSGLLFFSRRVGAFFYVPPASAESARALLREAGFQPYEDAGSET